MRNASILCLAAALAGCGWKSDGHARLDELYPDGGTDGGGDTGPVDLGDPQCSGIGGQWAVRLVQPGTIAPTGSPWDMTVTDLFLGTIDAGAAALALTFCDELTTIQSQPSAELSQQTRDALGASALDIALPGDGTFGASDQYWLWGVRNMTSPLTDALPTVDDYASAVPRLEYDEDGDDNPGVTVHVLYPLSGHRYVVKRAIWSFGAGTVSADNAWLTGALTYGIEESPLGADQSYLVTSAPITPSAGAVYQLRCVGTTFTCDALVQHHEAVFAEAP